MAKCFKRGELPKSHHTYGKLLYGSTETCVGINIQFSCIQGTLHSHYLEPNGNKFTILCATFINFRVVEARLVRMHELVFFRMVAAEQVPEGSGEQGKLEKTGCKIICGAPKTLAVKGLMIMMMRTCSCRALAAIFSTNSLACVLHPSNAHENHKEHAILT